MGRSRISPEDWPGEDWPNVVERGGYAVAPILTKSYVQWLSSGPPSLGKVFRLAFRKRSACRAHDRRIEASKVGRKAKLIHLQSSELNVKTLRWMIAENVYRAAQLEAESVHCRSSCPITSARSRPFASISPRTRP